MHSHSMSKISLTVVSIVKLEYFFEQKKMFIIYFKLLVDKY